MADHLQTVVLEVDVKKQEQVGENLIVVVEKTDQYNIFICVKIHN